MEHFHNIENTINNWSSVKKIDRLIDEENRSWQIRISAKPTRSNIVKAAEIIKQMPLFNTVGKRYPDLKLFVSKDDQDLSTWDGTISGGDRNQLGKEICVFMDYDSQKKTYEFTPSEYKEFMLELWAALEQGGVELNYIPTPIGEKAVPTAKGIVSPFFYSSFKDYTYPRKRHGIMHSSEYNEKNFEDPLLNVRLTQSDLKRHKILGYKKADVLLKRMQFLDDHIVKAKETFLSDLSDILHPSEDQTSSNFEGTVAWLDGLATSILLSDIASDEALTTMNNSIISACETIYQMDNKIPCESRLPRAADSNLALIYDHGSLKNELKSGARDTNALGNFLVNLNTDVHKEIEKTVAEFMRLDFINCAGRKVSREEIKKALVLNPLKMQTLFRRGYHIKTEIESLRIEVDRYQKQVIDALTPTATLLFKIASLTMLLSFLIMTIAMIALCIGSYGVLAAPTMLILSNIITGSGLTMGAGMIPGLGGAAVQFFSKKPIMPELKSIQNETSAIVKPCC